MTKDMTQGSPLKLILAFAVPLMLGSLFQQFYNLADTIIVGRFVGVEALAAVGSVGGLNYLVLGFVNGIACGFSIPISWTFLMASSSACFSCSGWKGPSPNTSGGRSSRLT